MAYLKDFRDRIERGDYPGFLKIWEEYCYGDQPDGEEIIAVLEAIRSSELSKHFGVHVERIIPLWRNLHEGPLSHSALRLILDIQTTQSEELANLATEYLSSRHPNDPLLAEKLRLVGLRNRESFSGAIRNFELLTHMEKGNFVFHTSGWGTGEILDVSLVREELSLEFECVLGPQSYTFEKAFRTLVPLSHNHFYTRRFGAPDELEKEAKEHPVQVIHLLLKDLGPKTAAEIKDELFDLIIPEKEWNRWWQTTRTKLKKDTKIQCPENLKDPFVLREQELPHEVLFHKQLEAKPSIQAAIAMIFAFLRDFSETLKNQEFKASLIAKIEEYAQEEHLIDAQKLQLWFLLDDLGNSAALQKASEMVEKNPLIGEIIRTFEILAFQKKALHIAKKKRGDWQEIFLELFLHTENNLLRDFLLSEMNDPSLFEPLKKKLTQLLIHPISFPETFLWYFQKIIAPKSTLPFSDEEGKARCFEALLILLSHAEKTHRNVAKKIVTLLTQNRYKVVRDIFEHSNQADVKEFLLLATKCPSLSDHDIKIFHSLAEVVHPELGGLRKEKETPEEIIWTTQEGLEITQQKIHHIATVETVHNAKEIESARALGDLRENAEFKAALERRDRLQSELKFLSDQVAKARVLTPLDVSSEKVGVGNVVHCKSSKGEHLCFTLLGPWDANPEERILSFQSKIAQAMKDKTIGETFSFQGETFEITDIENYFDKKGSRR